MKNALFILAIVCLTLTEGTLAKPTATNRKEKQLLDQLLALKQEGDDGDGRIILQQDGDGGIIVKQATKEDDDDNGIVLQQEDDDGGALSKLDLKALEKGAEKDAESQYYYGHRYYYHGHYYYRPYHVVHVHVHHHYHHYGK